MNNLFKSFFLILVLNPVELHSMDLFFDGFEKREKSALYQSLKDKKIEIVKEGGINHSAGLKVTYVSSQVGSERIVVHLPLTKAVNEATLSYYVKFDRDFQFVKGGKLHGLGPNNPITGGGEMTPSGWSSRVMFQKEGKVSTYLYVQDKNKKYGIALENREFKFMKNIFYKVSLYTKLNSTPSKADGEAHIYIDGRLVVKHQNLLFWKNNSKEAKISQFLFSTFHGGHDKSWAPKDQFGKYKNITAIFDNFLVSTGLKTD